MSQDSSFALLHVTRQLFFPLTCQKTREYVLLHRSPEHLPEDKSRRVAPSKSWAGLSLCDFYRRLLLRFSVKPIQIIQFGTFLPSFRVSSYHSSGIRNQRSEAESQIRSTNDAVLHAVSIPAYHSFTLELSLYECRKFVTHWTIITWLQI